MGFFFNSDGKNSRSYDDYADFFNDDDFLRGDEFDYDDEYPDMDRYY